MDWYPLTVREGRPRPEGPYEGVPAHLRTPIQHWLDIAFGYRGPGTAVSGTGAANMLAVAAACRIQLTHGGRGSQHYHEIVRFYDGDPERLLDVIHATIQLVKPPVESLDRMLLYGGSAWTATYTGLQQRADPTARRAFDAASQPVDVASEELRHAWGQAYDREPDASDAWDHAIKAIEAILIPIVVPNQAKPTLGHVVSHLHSQGHLWQLSLPGPNEDYSVEPLVAMLRLLWPNPDRHGSPQHRRPPTLVEAQAVVHLAVTVVQWGRDGQILKKSAATPTTV